MVDTLVLIGLLSNLIFLFHHNADPYFLIAIKVFASFCHIKITQHIKFLQILLNRFIRALIKLKYSFIRLLVVMMFYSILGLQLFKDNMNYRCRITPYPQYQYDKWEIFNNIPFLCGKWSCPEKYQNIQQLNLTIQYIFFITSSYCRSPKEFDVTFDEKETDIVNMNFSFTKFDNIGYSFLTIFHLTRTTGWSSITFLHWRHTETVIVGFYVVSVMIICAYTLANMILAILYQSYEEQTQVKDLKEYKSQEEQFIKQQIQFQVSAFQKMKYIENSSNKQKSLQKVKSALKRIIFNIKMDYHSYTNMNIFKKMIYSNYYKTFQNLYIFVQIIMLLIDRELISKNQIDISSKLTRLLIICNALILQQRYKKIQQLEFINIKVLILNKIYFKSALNIIDLIILFLVLLTRLSLFQDKPMYISIIKGIQIFPKEIFQLLTLIIIYALILGLLGYQIFQSKAKYQLNSYIKDQINGYSPRVNFDNIENAFQAVLLMLLNEEWHMAMYNFMRTYSEMSCFFWIFIVSTGELLLMKLLIAIFINKYLYFIKQQKEQSKQINQIISQALLQIQGIDVVSEKQSNTKRYDEQQKQINTNLKLASLQYSNIQISPQKEHNYDISNQKFPQNSSLSNRQIIVKEKNQINYRQNSQDNTFQYLQINNQQKLQQQTKEIQAHKLNNEQVYLNYEKKSKQISQKIDKNYKFQNFMIMVCLINCILMPFNSPLMNPHSEFSQMLKYLDYLITFLYLFEILIKMSAQGYQYFKNQENKFEFGLFIVNVLNFIFSQQTMILKLFRPLRIFKLIKYFQSMKILIISLFKSVSLLIKLVIFAFCFMLILVVYPLKILKGKMKYCTLSEGTDIHSCMDLGGDWLNQDFNWDNTLISLFNLYLIATSEGWSEFIFQAQDAYELNYGPVRLYNKYWSYFFIIFFFIINILVINTFVGALIDKFSNINNKYYLYILNALQKKYYIQLFIISLVLIFKKAIPPKKEDRLRFILYEYIKNKRYKFLINLSIILSIIQFSIEYQGQSEIYQLIQDIINYILLFILALEVSIKFFVQQKQVFINKMNIFDIFLLITNIIQVVLINKIDDNDIVNLQTLKNIFQMFKIFRFFRVVKTFKLLEDIFNLLFQIVPHVTSVLCLLIIIIYIYAVIGLYTFAYLKPQQYVNGYDLHFKNFSSSFFTLMRVASGEQWFQIAADIIRQQQPNFVCFKIKDYNEYIKYGKYIFLLTNINLIILKQGLNECGTKWGYLYIFSFHFFTSLIVLNLFIAIILDSMMTQDKANSTFQLLKIKNLWRKYDRKGYGFINFVDFWQFTSKIALIYGVRKDELVKIENKKSFLKFLDIPIYAQINEDGTKIFGIRFHDVVIRFTQISLLLKHGVMMQKYIQYNFFFKQKKWRRSSLGN
ncbi:hypothetical protein IMG5_049970 [Ichthyophthirius multifiliis]|uniref:Ion transport domain-containing protein n=1 Tax=Ichthyophthirius multifiliis TaxID=5932 RepID=G0QML8_ICHMU|nr:hypothetical protein IMG5_049970 [Ichthyophthirius multifiliis]EGR33537.1 hypothetical protein IMG5_049970 [Ichthyophthirius multifiliis]|eukprot:XP_004037523.1 hypothetical protein IMG5_049970 [Ichthyophthirius multifiliis]